MSNKKTFWAVSILIFLGLVVPSVLFWKMMTNVPTITVSEAKELYAHNFDSICIIDARSVNEYSEYSLDGSINVPLKDISDQRLSEIEGLRDKKNIFVICNSGVRSAFATEKLHSLGYMQAFSVEGGLDEWRSGGKSYCGKKACKFTTADGPSAGINEITFSYFEQLTIVVAAFGIKPLYEILALIIAIMLWKSLQPEFISIRRAMLAFFIGENACAVNFLFYNEQSLFFEYLHCYGMLVCFGLMSYAMMTFFDKRIFKYSNKDDKCSLLPICGKCYKYTDVACTLKQFFLFAIPATIINAMMPLTAQVKSFFYVGDVLGSQMVFGHSSLQQVLEARLCPVVAIFFFILAWLVLLIKKEKGFQACKILFAIGLGPLGFSMLRFFVFWVYSDNPLWAEAWEELSEFMFICGLMFVVIKRHLILKAKKQNS